tara:strand:- start:51 stop:512 length:462 start_codon:yes stop_codon:yes gene_type:complete
MIYNNKLSEDRSLFRNLFKQSIRIASQSEQPIILEKLLNICKPHILEEFPDRLKFKGYGGVEDKPAIYGDNYIINRLYRCARVDYIDDNGSSYFESFHITISAIIDNIPVKSTFYIVWKDIAYTLDADLGDIIELLCISQNHINAKIYKYLSI